MPLYREFGEHATRLSDPAYKVYVTLLIYADHRDGAWYGTVAELGRLVGKSPASVRRILSELEGHYLRIDGRGELRVTIHRYQGGRDAGNTAVAHRRRKAIERTAAMLDESADTTPSVVAHWVSEGLRRLGGHGDEMLKNERKEADETLKFER